MKRISPNYFSLFIIQLAFIIPANVSSAVKWNFNGTNEVNKSHITTVDYVAAVIRVPEDYATIQEAVDAASDDDVIILSRGTYTLTETVIINKRITLTSEFVNSGDEADVDATVVNSNNSLDPLILFNAGALNSKCVGITFKDAHKQLTLACDYMEVLHCKFFDNTSDALSLEGAGGYMAFNYFENCGDEAIDADDSLDWIVEYNTIINPGDDGLEIRLHNNDNSARLHIIRYNYISGADEDGIQLIDYDGDSGREFQIHHNIIINSAMVGLGCTANGNTVEDFEGSYMVEKTYIYNNVFDKNDHGITGANNMLVFNNIISNSTTVALKNLANNSSADYNEFFNNATDFLNTSNGPDNIFADPLFNADYSLQVNSPAIDSGTRTYANNSLSYTVAESDILGAFPDRGAIEFEEGVLPSNTAPMVSAGINQVILAPNASTTLLGMVTDDGLPDGGSLTAIWSLTKGPSLGNVLFEDPNEVSTNATFTKQGTYELKLSADDGEKSSSDNVTILYVKDFRDTTISLTGSDYIEAEDYRYLVGSATVMANVEASAGEIVRAIPGEGTYAYSQYRLVTFVSGNYYIWINASGPNVDSNGLSVAFNDMDEEQLLDVTVSNSFNDESWVRFTFENIPEGVYPLRISATEEGVGWDRIFITTDPTEAPYEMGTNSPIIYPVPNNGQFNIALNDLSTTKIEIFNILGQLKYSRTVSNTLRVALDIGIIGSGIYAVRISNEKGTTNKKMIIR